MMMNLTTKQPPLAAGGPRQQQLERNQLLNSSTKIKNVITSLSTQPPCSQSQNNLHLSNSNYPLGLMPLATQIAGHGSEGDGQRAILKREDGKILKPIQPPPKGPREANFYVEINRSNHPIDALIRNHIPKFHGLEQVGFTNGIVVTEDFLVLDDITEGFELPTVMDIKVGKQTWGPDATEAKKVGEASKYVGTKGPYGFSILGMIVHAHEETASVQVQQFDKSFGKNLKTQEVHRVPELFFCHDQKPPIELVKIVVEKITTIRDVFELQRRYKIYASSLLLTYDSQAVRNFKKGKITQPQLAQSVNIRLIDFAHVFDANGERDDNFLHGLNNLLDLFSQYQKRTEERSQS